MAQMKKETARTKKAAATKKPATQSKIVEANRIAQYRQGLVDRLQTNRQGDISNWGMGATIASQKGRNQAFNSLTSSAKTAGRAKNVGSKLKKAAAAKEAAKKASSPMKTSARSHQGDLAKISGSSAARAAASTPGRPRRAGSVDIYVKAKNKTLKSFK